MNDKELLGSEQTSVEGLDVAAWIRIVARTSRFYNQAKPSTDFSNPSVVNYEKSDTQPPDRPDLVAAEDI